MATKSTNDAETVEPIVPQSSVTLAVTRNNPLSCRPTNCELKRDGKFGDATRYACPRCGFTTVDEDRAASRNPKLANRK